MSGQVLGPLDRQLRASYLGFFLPAGVLLSYLPPFLRDKGLAPDEVGWIFSAVFGVKLLTGPLLAWWADAARRQAHVLWAAAWAGVAAAWLLGSSTRFATLLASVIVIAVCRNYFQCLLEALATRVRDLQGGSRYGSVRAFGSLAVCAGVLLYGGIWSAGSAWQRLALPAMVLGSSLVLVACLRPTQAAARQIAATPVTTTAMTTATTATGPTRPALTPRAVLLLAGASLLIGANGVFYSSATLLLEQRGLPPPAVAGLWCAAFGIEALGFAAFDRLRARWGNARLFGAVIALALLRWSLLASAGPLPWLLLGFALHVASLSWTHALCALWIRELWPARYAVTGQAVYLACAHGIGLAGASWLASRALPTWGCGVYGLAAAMTAAGALLVVVRASLEQRARLGGALQVSRP